MTLPRLLISLCSGYLALLCSSPTNAAEGHDLQVQILYLQQVSEPQSGLSTTLRAPHDQGLRGAELGIADNNTTGKFLGHLYQLSHVQSTDEAKLLEQAKRWLEENTAHRIIVADTSTEVLRSLTAAQQNVSNLLIFNAGNQDDSLRSTDCRRSLLHTSASHAMLADGLLQFLNVKRWNKLFFIVGSEAVDQQFARSLRRSIKRFGGKLVDQKTWSFNFDLRRTAQSEVPLFTRAKDYDAVLIADAAQFFGDFVLYNTWLPRPVVGTHGLTPIAWHRSVEQWGALQLQSRFHQLAGRWMNDVDYAAWVALRSIAEAVTRTQSIDVPTLIDYLYSDDFEIAGFKGQKLSYRVWNGQLRQPIPLVHHRGLVSQSPQEGYLHPRTDLDTLGFDAPEVSCVDK